MVPLTIAGCLLHGRCGAECVLLDFFKPDQALQACVCMYAFNSQASSVADSGGATQIGDVHFMMSAASVSSAGYAGSRINVSTQFTISSCEKRGRHTGSYIEGGSSMRKTPLLATRRIVLVVQICPCLTAARRAEETVASHSRNVDHVIHSWVVGGCCECPTLCSSPIIGPASHHAIDLNTACLL